MATESYLITGGCGLQGSSIVETLRAKFPEAKVAVVTRNPTVNIFEGVTYHRGDIRDAPFIASCLAECKPSVVFHCAATVVGARKHVSDETVRSINVDGTRVLLEQCAKAGTKAFVFTSSVSVIQKPGVIVSDADETWPLIGDSDTKALIYPRTKAESERLVTAADDPDGMRTASLRPSAIHGERDNDVTPIIMRTSAMKGLQIGENKTRFATTYVGNSTQAHLLVAEKLLSPDPDVRNAVGGQAFFVTNGAEHSYYDFSRTIWKYAGVGDGPGSPEYENVRVVPTNVAMWVAWACEWWGWAWGTPPVISTVAVGICTMERWYKIGKAERLLGYHPSVGWEEGCRRAAKWYLEHGNKTEEDAKTK
ncbi:hypothetical protein JX265_009877 [Neoarthrinium moseri]|uniref:Ketoreductase domain-containing protein n=1 Tax=Neoarthrinium moseri TaxID=1658444 RepID=A0A9Q0AL60_9PEZI|nr:hypothetical protein JX265_009877 [Neoarthrinium moseri]